MHGTNVKIIIAVTNYTYSTLGQTKNVADTSNALNFVK